jgi:hypothetical protein
MTMVGDEFIGTWKLASFEQHAASGGISYPLGANPVGRLAYDPSGRMSVQIMRPNRPGFHGSSGSPEEKIAAFDGYLAYYGTYTVNPADRTVVHHLEASVNPDWVGIDLTRSYEFSDSQLTLVAASQGSERRLVWERAR